MAGFSSTGPLDLPTIGQAAGDTAPHSLSEYYNISFTDGSSTPSAGPISIGNFLGKTIGFGAGAPWTQQGKLISPNASLQDFFGYSVAISGDYAVIGAWREDPTTLQPSGPYGPGYYSQADGGAAYVYKRATSTTAYYTQGNWYFQARLTPTDLEPGDHFGISVAIDGDYIIVGARSEDPGNVSSAGSAYIFVRSQTGSWPHPVYGSTWAQQKKLTGSPTGQNYLFGDTVAIDGLTAVVGVSRESLSGGLYLAGAVYVFVRSGTSWSQQQKLTAPNPAIYDLFGYSVAIDGNNIIVGTPYADHVQLGQSSVYNCGSAYIFVRSGTSWSQQAKLTASDKETSDLFGYRVDIDGDYVVIGSIYEDPSKWNGTSFQTVRDAGSAYIFVRSGTSWSQQAKLTASDSDKQLYDNFGSDVAIDGSRVVIGARSDDEGASEAGATYVFVRSGSSWTRTKLINSDAATRDITGFSVSISGNTLVTGAYLHTSTSTYQTEQGAAYIYTI
jgi:hypothetical protein